MFSNSHRRNVWKKPQQTTEKHNRHSELYRLETVLFLNWCVCDSYVISIIFCELKFIISNAKWICCVVITLRFRHNPHDLHMIPCIFLVCISSGKQKIKSHIIKHNIPNPLFWQRKQRFSYVIFASDFVVSVFVALCSA